MRLRWAVRGVLVLGVAASIAANILHAQPHPVSQTIAAWPSIALLLTVELIARVPVYQRTLAIVRRLATTAIAGIAAWVSYWHMVDVAVIQNSSAWMAVDLDVHVVDMSATCGVVGRAGKLSRARPRGVG